jgi:hypothetical protein
MIARNASLLSFLLLAMACQSTAGGAPPVAGTASEAQRAALLGRFCTLAGTWEATAPDGSKDETVFTVCSQGSALREVMFPGKPYEMTNIYHMDGASLLMTHYCAEGNQPRMRAIAPEDNVVRFAFDSVTNLRGPDEPYMGSLVVTFLDSNHVRYEWQHHQAGRVDSGARFELTRKQ